MTTSNTLEIVLHNMIMLTTRPERVRHIAGTTEQQPLGSRSWRRHCNVGPEMVYFANGWKIDG